MNEYEALLELWGRVTKCAEKYLTQCRIVHISSIDWSGFIALENQSNPMTNAVSTFFCFSLWRIFLEEHKR